MTWPGWGEVGPLIVAVLAIFGAIVGGMRAVTRTVAEQAAIVAKDVAQDVVKEGNESLYELLKTYDFPRVEAKIDRGLAEARADREAMETRIRERLDRVDARMDRMGASMGDRMDRMGASMGDRMDRMGDRVDRMGARMERMEARILEAVRRRSDADGDADEAEA